MEVSKDGGFKVNPKFTVEPRGASRASKLITATNKSLNIPVTDCSGLQWPLGKNDLMDFAPRGKKGSIFGEIMASAA